MIGIDWLILFLYFVFVLGIGVALRGRMKTSTDFFLAGRAMPAWVCGLAFLSANLGAQEVIGMGASGAKYGIATSHFYWIGAIPAMIFIALFMMPFYYGSRARSVPEYLKLRFDEKTRAVNAISFATMTVFSSGISLYAMGKLLHLLLGWSFDVSILVAAGIVLGSAPLGGFGLRHGGGWAGLVARLAPVSTANGFAPDAYTRSWAYMGQASHNPVGVEWFGLVMGLGFVLSFGYWCTDFLVVQRAMAANSMTAARRTPLIAAVPKMFFPFLVILPGMIAGVVSISNVRNPAPTRMEAVSERQAQSVFRGGKGIIPPKYDSDGNPVLRNGQAVLDYDLATPMMLVRFFPSGLLGIGLCALIASFMSGMAGNTTAFNTVWTYDIYQSYLNKTASDQHYLWMGRAATVFGLALSVLAAYVAKEFNNIMDVLQLVFAFVNAPLFATFMLGMFWKRATGHGAFCGLLGGMLAAAVHNGLTLPAGATPGLKGGFLGSVLHGYPSEMAQNFWTAIFAWVSCFAITIIVSLCTRPRPDVELKGLVYSLTPKPKDEGLTWYQKPGTLAVVVLVVMIALNVVFW